ncbi:Retinoblastoma-associated protein [Holothuria leucospilota]|uniref:Retinoblastoma-associated protein n=1 Tax=Holothuria leucospilota TaxID=206669 RepID=A0A9Q1BQD4_HOLLE|nr:Retinoblastoma-associated protein [Holothuria leucospilota]
MSGASLEECALRLGLPDVVKRKANKVLEEWAQSKDFQNDALWIACAIYTAVIECSMKSFLDCMDFIEKRYEYSKALKDRFIGTKKKYGITLDMYLTFQRLMDEIFQAIEKRQMPLSVKDAVVKAFSCLQQYRRRVCWCLFLVAKETIRKNAEEMNPVQLLLCCIHYIMKQVPHFMLKEHFRTAKSADVANGFAHSSMLSEINVACHSGRINDINMGNLLDKLLAVQANMFEPFLKKIPQDKLNQGADGLPELDYLEGKYKAIYEKVADIDEMTFLENDPVLMPVGEPHPCATSPDTTMGDVCQPVTHTPARTLNTILANATDKPSSSLLAFLKEYGVEASVINKRVESLKEVFVTAYSPACGKNQKTIAETRYRLGEKPRKAYSSSSKKFLSGDVFHKCLLACCLEIVKVTKESCASPGQASPIYNGPLSFPWILSIFKLHAYDFCKVIETFIREEPLLCKEAVEYLIKAEELILKREAWKEGSPLFDALKEKGILRDSNNVCIHVFLFLFCDYRFSTLYIEAKTFSN